MVQLVKRRFDFGSGYDVRVLRMIPVSGSALGMEPA